MASLGRAAEVDKRPNFIEFYKLLRIGLLISCNMTSRSGLLWLQGEELQVDGVAHGFVTGIVGMEVVAWVVAGQEGVRVIRVADRGLEVDEAIQGTSGPNPVIYGLADRFPVFGVVAGAMIGG